MNAAGSATKYHAWFTVQEPAALAVLGEIVAIDRGSYNKPGTDAVGRVIRHLLEGHGIAVAVLPRQKHGDCARWCQPGAGSATQRRTSC